MAHIEKVMVNGVLTDVQKLDHSAQQVDDAVGRALPGGEIETQLSKKVNETVTVIDGQDIKRIAQHGKCGWFAGNSVANSPPENGDAYQFFEIISLGTGWARVICYDFYGVAAYWAAWYGGETWTAWTKIATATKPEEHDLPLAEGYHYGDVGGAWYKKAQDDTVTLTVSNAKKIDGTGLATGVIGYLPVGYRPQRLVSVSGVLWGPAQAVTLLQALPDGSVWITVATEGTESIHGEMSFTAASDANASQS